jgi:hypothetical protein
LLKSRAGRVELCWPSASTGEHAQDDRGKIELLLDVPPIGAEGQLGGESLSVSEHEGGVQLRLLGDFREASWRSAGRLTSMCEHARSE